jgi:large subunit ribosomal protein L29
MKQNAEKARSLDSAAIQKQLSDDKEQMFRLRFQMSMGQTDGVNKLRLLRKERARMLTVLRERALGGDQTPVASKRASAPASASPAPKKVSAKASPIKAAAVPKAPRKTVAPKASGADMGRKPRTTRAKKGE